MMPNLLDQGAVLCLEYGVLFYCRTFSWVSVGVHFFREHSAEYTEWENVSLCSCFDLDFQGRGTLVFDFKAGVQFVAVVAAVLFDGRKF